MQAGKSLLSIFQEMDTSESHFRKRIKEELRNPFDVSGMRRRTERVCDKLGSIRKSPHKARRTYGSILLNSRIDKDISL